MPYSFSFCFNISHFSFWASERNNYASPLPSSLTSAVSARASVLSTMMSNFSPRSMILSMPHVASYSHTNVVDHHALHRVQLLLHTRSRVRIRIVPLRLHISHTQGHDHQLTNRRGHNTKRHIAVSHSHVRDTLLVQDGEIVLATNHHCGENSTCRSGSCVSPEEGTW